MEQMEDHVSMEGVAGWKQQPVRKRWQIAGWPMLPSLPASQFGIIQPLADDAGHLDEVG